MLCKRILMVLLGACGGYNSVEDSAIRTLVYTNDTIVLSHPSSIATKQGNFLTCLRRWYTKCVCKDYITWQS